ncbi:helix-turn-helix domain-containing protein [Nonomuraea sp. 3N208]|uniref:helix-turn-helix domain-containing protein n=1 Tax=Nonomuraea sp. 3N208 TaxID=3457421 RepID=UPI003FD1508D
MAATIVPTVVILGRFTTVRRRRRPAGGHTLAAGEIASRFPISAPSISRHLGGLKGAGLVTERRDGNRILYTLAEERLATCVGRFLSAVCPEQIILRHTKWRRTAEGEEA